jgi:hypothetical protein
LTAAARDVRELVEDAVIARLMPLRITHGGYLAAVKEYAGELSSLRDDVTADQIKRAVGGHVPAVLVAAGSEQYESLSVSRDMCRGFLAVEILIVGAFARSREDRQRGGDGLYAAMRDIRAKLHGWDSDVADVGRLMMAAEEPMLQTVDLSVWKTTLRAEHITKSEKKPAGKPVAEIMVSGNLPEISGKGDAFTFDAGTGTVTLFDALGGFVTAMAGLDVVIAGATSPGNNGTFPGLAVVDDTHVQFHNPAGVAEAYAGSWTIKRATPVVQGLTVL